MSRRTLTLLAAAFALLAWTFAGVRIANAQVPGDPRQEALMSTYSTTPEVPVVLNPAASTFRANTVVGPVVTFPHQAGLPADWAALRQQRLAELADEAERKINFAFDSSELEAGVDEGLVELAELLASNPDIGLTVAGHTDLAGADGYNLDLGLRRANAIRAGLLDHGVASTRVRVQSFGEKSPLSRFEGPERVNRRVEITLFDLFSE